MLRSLPIILGAVASTAALLLLGPIAVAVLLLRSSPDAQGPALGAYVVIGFVLLAVTALAGLIVWALTRLVIRLFRRQP